MGKIGFIGIIISIMLISYIIYKIFKIIVEKNINTYGEFIENILQDTLMGNRILVNTISNIINIFLLISFNVMVAGFATYFVQELNSLKWIGASIIALLTFITLLKSIDGVIKINTYLIPIIIILILFLGFEKIQNKNIVETINNSNYWILSSILYASYNSITLIPILISLKSKIKSKKIYLSITILVTIIMLILSVIIFLLMNTYIESIHNIEIPIIYIAGGLGKCFRYIYGIVVLMAIFTTAVSAQHSFLSNIDAKGKKYILYSGIICLLSIFIGQISFSSLISLLYPVLGYLGIIQIFFLIIH